MRRLALVLLAMALVGSACGGSPQLSGSLAKMSLVSPEFKDAVSHLRGKPLVVNFWATWCDPCKAELPRIAQAAKRYRGQIAFLGVDVQDNSGFAARFARHAGVIYDSVPDPRRTIAQSQGLLGLPVTQFYDATGKQVGVHQGELKTDVLASELTKLRRG